MAGRKDVFVIQKEGDKTYWHRCGVGFVNRDESITIKLDLFPNLPLQVRDAKERDNGETPVS
jgi:hypothetical protein